MTLVFSRYAMSIIVRELGFAAPKSKICITAK